MEQTVLLVSDHLPRRNLLASFLRLQGCVVEPLNAQDLFTSLRFQRTPDIIILDASLPSVVFLDLLEYAVTSRFGQQARIVILGNVEFNIPEELKKYTQRAIYISLSYDMEQWGHLLRSLRMDVQPTDNF
jgi:CheY-like chemotaxis protein